jgi:hypothetical protein
VILFNVNHRLLIRCTHFFCLIKLAMSFAEHLLARSRFFFFVFIFSRYFTNERNSKKKKGTLCYNESELQKINHSLDIVSGKAYFFKTPVSQSYCACPFSLSTRKREKKPTRMIFPFSSSPPPSRWYHYETISVNSFSLYVCSIRRLLMRKSFSLFFCYYRLFLNYISSFKLVK